MTISKIKQRLHNLTRVVKVLEQINFTNKLSPIEESGVVKHFELAFELSWKLMKDILEHEGIVGASSPRSVIKDALITKIIDDESWLLLVKTRNESTHIYDLELSAQIVQLIEREYIDLFVKFIKQIKQKYE